MWQKEILIFACVFLTFSLALWCPARSLRRTARDSQFVWVAAAGRLLAEARRAANVCDTARVAVAETRLCRFC